MTAMVVVEHDARWAELFDRERELLERELGDRVLGIEHIGSTAVPGLAAKPIVDIVVGVAGGSDLAGLDDDLSRLGYERRPEGDFPGRRFFVRRGRAEWPRVHLSVCEHGGVYWREQALFRDALRADPRLADRYAALKRGLAGRDGEDRRGYTRAKTEFVREVLGSAGDPAQTGRAERPLAGRTFWFAGIGGAGMSALARVARDWGAEVRGWDRVSTPYLEALGDVAVEIAADPPAPPPGAEVVVSTAFTGRVCGRSRGELLAELVSLRPSIVVAGAHGKTTTTAMIAFCLDRLGLDPTYLVGGPVPQLGGNARAGNGWLVAEGDESDRSLELLRPEIGVLTNVDLDHHSTFKSRLEVETLFERWLAGCAQAVRGDRLEPADLELAVPGEHNRRNAAAALAALELAGVARPDAERVLVEFRGAGRRLERKGEVGGVTVWDDYAHHPAEIEATLEAARAANPGRRVVVLFQPHLYSRTRHLARGLAAALAWADSIVVTDIYPAREEPIAGVTGKLVVDALSELRPGSVPGWAPRLEDAAAMTARRARAGDIVLTLGAGDVDRAGGLILGALASV